MKIAKVYGLDAVFDNPDDVPEDVMMDHPLSPFFYYESLVYFCLMRDLLFLLVMDPMQVKLSKHYSGLINWTIKV